MNSIYQDIIGRIAAIVGSIAISLGIIITPMVSPTTKQFPVVTGTTEILQKMATPAAQPTMLRIAIPKSILTSTPTTTPQLSACEIQIKEILPEVENAFTKLQALKKARWEVGHCTSKPEDSQEKKDECQRGNNSVENQANKMIMEKMNDYRAKLMSCDGQEVKFSKYSSKISAEY